jgi:hypothetical protein
MALAPMRSNNAMSDMAAIMEKARAYSDSRLADVLAGKDVSIPQYVAMTEAMGRKQLRQAVDGAQAQQQAQQPSLKDRLLAEQSAPQAIAGIDQLPAPNMEAMGEGMAAGGIVAFSGKDGSYVDPAILEAMDPEKYARQKRQADAWKSVADSGKPYSVEEFRSDVVDPLKRFFTAPWDKAAAADVQKEGIAKLMKEKNIGAKEAAALYSVKDIQTQDSPLDYDLYDPNKKAKPSAAAPAAAAPAAASNSAINLSQPTTFERRANPFGEMSAEKVDVEGLKSRGLGEGLMRLSAGLLSAPGAKGVSAGIAGLAEQAGLTRKETNALKKDARDYDLNRARAEAAFEQGQDELGLKYTEAANINRYRMASLAQEPGELRTLRAVANDPTLAGIYKGANKGELYSVEAATKAFNDILEKNTKYARSLADMGVRDPLSYRQFVINGLSNNVVSATVPEGAKTRS